MKLSIFCLTHYSDFRKLLAESAIAVNQTTVTSDVELMAGDRVAIYYHHIGIRFFVVTQTDIDTSKTYKGDQ